MKIPDDLRYTQTHEWVRKEADGTVSVGITDHAQDALGELVYVELPVVGRQVLGGDACAVVESTKAASDVFAPLPGEVIAVNAALKEAPGELNKDPYGTWLFRLRPAAQADLSRLLDAQAYKKAFP
jgi:glycine cleavage system H protein